MVKKALSYLLVVSIMLLSGHTAVHANKPAADGMHIGLPPGDFSEAVHRLEPFVRVTTSKAFVLSVSARQLRDLGVDRSTLHMIRSGMLLVNREILSGNLIAEGFIITDPRVARAAEGIDSLEVDIRSISTNRIIYHWWGLEVHLTNETVNMILGLLQVGAGLTVIAAALSSVLPGPWTVILAIAGGIVAMYAGVLTMCNRAGQGIRVFVTPVAAWCTGP